MLPEPSKPFEVSSLTPLLQAIATFACNSNMSKKQKNITFVIVGCLFVGMGSYGIIKMHRVA
jgi:hypothetical protein